MISPTTAATTCHGSGLLSVFDVGHARPGERVPVWCARCSRWLMGSAVLCQPCFAGWVPAHPARPKRAYTPRRRSSGRVDIDRWRHAMEVW